MMTTTTQPLVPLQPFTTLVVGGTGATGRHVVRQLLAQTGHHVVCVVRSRAAMLRALHDDDTSSGLPSTTTTTTTLVGDNNDDNNNNDRRLTIYEGSVLDMSDQRLAALFVDHHINAIVSCLGHNLSVQGLFGPPRRLVTDTLIRLVQACQSPELYPPETTNPRKTTTTKPKTTIKLLLLNTAGVYIPHVDDDRRTTTSRMERFLFWLLRNFLPPHADNEAAAAYLDEMWSPDRQKQHKALSFLTTLQWVVIRPTNLINETHDDDDDDDDNKATTAVPASSEYIVMDQPPPGGVLFGPNANSVVSRRNVATFMVRLLTDDTLFNQYQFAFPVIHNKSNNNKSNNKNHNNKTAEATVTTTTAAATTTAALPVDHPRRSNNNHNVNDTIQKKTA